MIGCVDICVNKQYLIKWPVSVYDYVSIVGLKPLSGRDPVVELILKK